MGEKSGEEIHRALKASTRPSNLDEEKMRLRKEMRRAIDEGDDQIFEEILNELGVKEIEKIAFRQAFSVQQRRKRGY
jgi:hypothetical protein